MVLLHRVVSLKRDHDDTTHRHGNWIRWVTHPWLLNVLRTAWRKDRETHVDGWCGHCGYPIFPHNESCPECGNPFKDNLSYITPSDLKVAGLLWYRVLIPIVLLGISVGITALIANSIHHEIHRNEVSTNFFANPTGHKPYITSGTIRAYTYKLSSSFILGYKIYLWSNTDKITMMDKDGYNEIEIKTVTQDTATQELSRLNPYLSKEQLAYFGSLASIIHKRSIHFHADQPSNHFPPPPANTNMSVSAHVHEGRPYFRGWPLLILLIITTSSIFSLRMLFLLWLSRVK